MNLAITLLAALAVSSVVGTVLQQNEPYQSYIIEFGPFWFEVYKALGLYDVYSAGWFVFVLGFLLLSTSLCVFRNAPGFVRDFRLQHSTRSLRAFAQHAEWTATLGAEALTAPLKNYLHARGFRVRVKPQGAGLLLAGCGPRRPGAATGRGIRRRPGRSSYCSPTPAGCTSASPRAGAARPWHGGR